MTVSQVIKSPRNNIVDWLRKDGWWVVWSDGWRSFSLWMFLGEREGDVWEQQRGARRTLAHLQIETGTQKEKQSTDWENCGEAASLQENQVTEKEGEVNDHKRGWEVGRFVWIWSSLKGFGGRNWQEKDPEKVMHREKCEMKLWDYVTTSDWPKQE